MVCPLPLIVPMKGGGCDEKAKETRKETIKGLTER